MDIGICKRSGTVVEDGECPVWNEVPCDDCEARASEIPPDRVRQQFEAGPWLIDAVNGEDDGLLYITTISGVTVAAVPAYLLGSSRLIKAAPALFALAEKICLTMRENMSDDLCEEADRLLAFVRGSK